MLQTSEEKTRSFGITSFALHILAMLFMLCDHLWGTFLMKYDILAYIGRITFPLFAFMLAEGWVHTKDRKKYILRLLIFALISEIPFNLMMEHRAFYPLHQNVLFTFLLGALFMALCDRIKKGKHLALRLPLYALAVLAFYLLGIICFVDYYGYGLLTVALFYFTRMPKSASLPKKLLVGLIQIAAMYWINCEMMAGLIIEFNLFGLRLEIYKQGFALLALPLIWLYNGRQGPYNKFIKYLYYFFYPVHMAILGILISTL